MGQHFLPINATNRWNPIIYTLSKHMSIRAIIKVTKEAVRKLTHKSLVMSLE